MVFSKDSIHSQRIRENPSVALAIFDSRAIGDDVDAVYIKAKAHEIKNSTELAQGLVVYVAKMVRTKFIGLKNAKKFINQSKV